MYIFVDESGSFAPSGNGDSSVSMVGALVIPEHKIDQLFGKYQRLRGTLPKHKGEVKGRLLDEAAIAKVVELLRKNSCIFQAVAIDMGLETIDGLQRHRAGQAEALTKYLTHEHHPEMVAAVYDLRGQLEAMPLQLYAQSVVTNQLIGNVLRFVPCYWSQRVINETLTYHWVIDGKDVGRLTNAENWWSRAMLGLLQSQSHREPMVFPDWIDHREFDRKFVRQRSEWLKGRLPGPDEALDLKLLLKESFRFSSEAEPGLELVDIVTNATRRAMSGNLAEKGWSGISRLMIHSREQYLHIVTLTELASIPARPYAEVVAKGFRAGGRPMLTPGC